METNAGETVLATTPGAAGGKITLQGREELLRAMQAIDQKTLAENNAFLVVINIADTKEYDEIIRIFGYKFADDILQVRLASLDFLTSNTTLYAIGFWSIGFILRPNSFESFRHFMDKSSPAHHIFLKRLVGKLDEPVICRGIPIVIKSGIGICDLMRGLGSAQDLLQATFIAGQVRNRVALGWNVCNYDLAADNRRAFSIISDVAQALAAPDEFELVYQPRIDLHSGKCIGAEALLRWRHPQLGLIPPNEFIPLVEMTGLIRELTNWVLGHAIRQAVLWQANDLNLKISVNVSVKNLDEDDFCERILMLLAHFKLEPSRLELEFSEAQAFSDIPSAMRTLEALRDRGVGIAIDDFGTGHNSFGDLQMTHANILKIDDSLLRALRGDVQRQNVVQSMIALAHANGISVVGEGVETAEVLELLSSWRCDCAQGYFIGRPMYQGEFLAWCEAKRA
jgi:EAL domain-containing protein (putative c-di-GMP-specific phosphodiesterase class I)